MPCTPSLAITLTPTPATDSACTASMQARSSSTTTPAFGRPPPISAGPTEDRDAAGHRGRHRCVRRYCTSIAAASLLGRGEGRADAVQGAQALPPGPPQAGLAVVDA